MSLFFHVVEEKLRQADRDGLFDDLPGAGRPLDLPDLSGVPEELRASYLMLRGAGFVPPELEARKEWLRLCDLVAACQDDGAREGLRAASRRALLRYRMMIEERGGNSAWVDYRQPVLDRLTRDVDS